MIAPTIAFSGNLGAKPSLKPVQGPLGPTVVANLRVAVTPRRRARDSDDWVDGETMWFNVSTWRTLAANCVASLNQGDRVIVRGRLTQRTWADADGVERPSFDVEADEIGLDIARYPAMSLRRSPAQRQEPAEEQVEQVTADDPDRWVSTGQVDPETGEVRLEAADDVEQPAAV